jgi:enterochelin esterase-like enzyme
MSLADLTSFIQKPFVKEKSTEKLNDFLQVHHYLLRSKRLHRKVKVDVFLPTEMDGIQPCAGILLNDGQDMPQLKLKEALTRRFERPENRNLVVVAVHAGDRMNEYGTAGIPDYAHRGWKAKSYSNFIIYQLMPFLRKQYDAFLTPELSAFAGFSLGGLSAMDIAWRHPQDFLKTGVFSGSFWWRSSQPDARYPDADRIMHYLIGAGSFKKGMQFWLQAGTKDEECDRNGNGVIDAIDDTLDLIHVLKAKGYRDQDVTYIEIEDGEHNFETWSKVFPEFLEWCFP